MVLAKTRHTDQWNRIEILEINLCICGQLIYNKGAKNIQWGKENLFNKCWENWTATCKKKETGSLFTPFTKINSKWIKDMNLRPETIKLLEENIERKLMDIGLGNEILDLTPKAKATEAKIKKWYYIKPKDSVQ
uniref:Uncharacterized protein n=1 Tax=Equus caballus TaxID=9796 RepID=A0A9L0SYG0_HORSE